MAAAQRANKSDKSAYSETPSHRRIRTIKPPAKTGTIKRSVIRKAIKEIMAEQAQASL